MAAEAIASNVTMLSEAMIFIIKIDLFFFIIGEYFNNFVEQ